MFLILIIGVEGYCCI